MLTTFPANTLVVLNGLLNRSVVTIPGTERLQIFSAECYFYQILRAKYLLHISSIWKLNKFKIQRHNLEILFNT